MPAQTPSEASQSIAEKPEPAGEDSPNSDELNTDTNATDTDDGTTEDDAEPNHGPTQRNRKAKWKSAVTYGVLPALALILALAAGYLKFMDTSSQDGQLARTQSVKAATDGTTAILSYRADTAEKDLTAAQDRLTGTFRYSYSSLIHDVVIPGAKQKQISSQAKVAAAASVSANPQHAVVLVFVDQTITMGKDAPTDTASSVRVTLDKTDGRWLIAAFDPI